MVPGLGPGLGDGGGKGQRRHMVSALGSCYLSPKGQGLRMSPGVVATGGGGRREPAYIRGGLGPATPLQAPPRPLTIKRASELSPGHCPGPEKGRAPLVKHCSS